jgi:hypothetical protein
MDELTNLKAKVQSYHATLGNTNAYRQVWQESLKEQIIKSLSGMIEASGLNAQLELHANLTNLEAIVCSLGQSPSGIAQAVGAGMMRELVKQNGSLIYQQLFNGKISVMVSYPHIENFGEERQPKALGIYRPEELKEAYLLRHMEEFVKELTLWEDFDDDAPSHTIGYKMNFAQTNG